MTRIVAGVAGGRRLAVPRGSGTRPTSERAREALFSTLEAHRGGLAGARVLDLYAGSGAVGLEALSRGAAAVLLVESNPRAVAVLRGNVRAVRLAGATVAADRVERVLATEPGRPAYDVVFADPPYAVPALTLRELLAAAVRRGWIADDAFVVVERATREGEFDWPAGWRTLAARRYGDATLWYGRPRERSDGEGS